MGSRDFQDFRPVRLTDRALFQRYLERSCRPRRLITFTFTNFFLWQHWDNFRWAIREEALCILAESPFGQALLPPIAAEEGCFLRATAGLLEQLQVSGRAPLLIELDAETAQILQNTWPDRFLREEYRPGANYVYQQEDLAKLAGKKYHSKRNHLHQFQREYPKHQLVPIRGELARRCGERFREWDENLHPGDPELALEAVGIEKALLHLEELGLKSAALLLEGEPVAFSFGEALSLETFCIHVEKANSRIPGAYQAINQGFVQAHCQAYRYINRAEDMGRPGLRWAKESYHPCYLERKYILRARG